MPKLVVRSLKVRDLPPELTEGLDVAPDEVVRVTIDAERGRLVDDLIKLADRMGEEAERQGLTDRKLADLPKLALD